jgi:hypothetical protein
VISARWFITNGPPIATGSSIGRPLYTITRLTSSRCVAVRCTVVERSSSETGSDHTICPGRTSCPAIETWPLSTYAKARSCAGRSSDAEAPGSMVTTTPVIGQWFCAGPGVPPTAPEITSMLAPAASSRGRASARRS